MVNYKFEDLAKTTLWQHFMISVMCFHPFILSFWALFYFVIFSKILQVLFNLPYSLFITWWPLGGISFISYFIFVIYTIFILVFFIWFFWSLRPTRWKHGKVYIKSWWKNIKGWKSFKVYHIGWKGLSPCYKFFLPYILIPIKNNESKVKIFRKTIF
jgi:hypothetical protein